ncbi:MAG TPA: hypothetical protein VK912_14360 [Longimicrobiales bacterium]|nr:hypothetical protein [Longimicrobiales bacterium]
MYSACIFCNSPLGRNDVIEIFPVGRRLAFDAGKGRLWVVCRSCERWNLSPLEERWEAIEWCEEQYRATRLRVSTPNVGLARLKSGLELVRIGEPQRPEFAAWRYGDQFGRRLRRAVLRTGAGLGVLGAGVAGGVSSGMLTFMFMGGFSRLSSHLIHGSPNTIIARIPGNDGRLVDVPRRDLRGVRLGQSADHPWELLVPHGRTTIALHGDAAYRASSALLPAMNRFGGSKRVVSDAVSQIERDGSPAAFLERAAHVPGVREPVPIVLRPGAIRLAIEMAVHEDVERGALEGELASLESAWRDAERIAAISDDLLLSRRISAALERLRGRPD